MVQINYNGKETSKIDVNSITEIDLFVNGISDLKFADICSCIYEI